MYELGASAFQISLFYKACYFVIRNPDATATKMSTLNDSSRARNFLMSKDTLAYLDLAVPDITGEPVNTTFRKVVTLDTSEEESNDDNISLPTNSSSSSSSRKWSKDTDEEEEEIVSKRKKKKKKKKYPNMFEL